MEVKSVKTLSLELKSKLEENFAYVWVKGELSQVKTHSSGHVYFVLKEDEYIINGISWKNTPLSCMLEEGTIVECYGKISTYPSRSSYQIIIKEARKVNQLGNIFLELEKLKAKLKEEGLFDFEKKKKIKQFNEKIAIITSPTGAVFHDIMHRINERFSCCEIFFYPVNVQGNGALPEIIDALTKADKENYDLIILARGGGSLEDLWIFNDEKLTRTIAGLNTPNITAIGHETDTTLVDFASSLRAPTPTAAAEMATPNKKELISNLNNTSLNTIKTYQNKLKQLQENLSIFNDRLETYRAKIEYFSQKLDYLNIITIEKIKNKINMLSLKLKQTESLQFVIKNFQERLNSMHNQCLTNIKNKLDKLNTNYINESQFIKDKKIELENKIIVSFDGKSIKSCKDLPASPFELLFFDGAAQVKKI